MQSSGRVIMTKHKFGLRDRLFIYESVYDALMILIREQQPKRIVLSERHLEQLKISAIDVLKEGKLNAKRNQKQS